MSRFAAGRRAALAVVATAAVAVLPLLNAGPAAADDPAPVRLFASPTVSDGDGDCSLASPCSLSDAIAAERAARAAMGTTMTSAIVVYLHGGTYQPSQPITLGSEDSGSGTGDDARVFFRNYPDESPVISGGTPVTGWTKVAGTTDEWTASTAGIDDFLQLYARGHHLVRAHTDAVKGQRWTVPGTRKMQLRVPKDAISPVADLTGVQVRMMDTWRSLRYPVASIGDPFTVDGKQYRYIQLGGRIAFWSSETHLDHGLNPQAPAGSVPVANGPAGSTVFSGAREFMTENGEWYLDQNADQVYLKADFDPNTVEMTAPVHEQLLSVSGAAHLTIFGIQFAHSAWNTPLTYGNFQRQGGVRMWDPSVNPLPDPGEEKVIDNGHIDNPVAGQSDDGNPTCTKDVTDGSGLPDCALNNPLWWVNPAAVRVEYSSDIQFRRNGFRDTGANAVNLDNGTHDIVFQANVFTDIADTGLFVGTSQQPWLPASEQNTDTSVVDNVFSGMGQTYATDSAITMTYPKRATIQHNLIENVGNIGVNIGYVQGMTGVETTLAGVNVLDNRFKDVCQIALDCAAWHAVGLSAFEPGVVARSRVARNYITGSHKDGSVTTAGSKVYALYSDGASAGWELKWNVWIPGQPTCPVDPDNHDNYTCQDMTVDPSNNDHGQNLDPGETLSHPPYFSGLKVNAKTLQHPIYVNGEPQDPILYLQVRAAVNNGTEPVTEEQLQRKATIKAEAGLHQYFSFLETIDLATANIGAHGGQYPNVS